MEDKKIQNKDSVIGYMSADSIKILSELIEWQILQRNLISINSRKFLVHGINYSILLNTACYIEGALSTGLRQLVYIPHHNDEIYKRMLNELMFEIDKTTGIDRINKIFYLFEGKNLNEIINDNDLWEDIKILFSLRNILAHGRSFIYSKDMLLEEATWEAESDSLNKIRQHLVKRNLFDQEILKSALGFDLFSNNVADYFWRKTQEFIKAAINNTENASIRKELLFRLFPMEFFDDGIYKL